MAGDPDPEAAVEELSQRAARGVTLAALAVACVIAGPVPQLVTAMERVYAVAMVGDDGVIRRSRHRTRRRRREPTGPLNHRPSPTGPGQDRR